MKILIILAALFYLIFPFDLIRDYFPLIGYIDDLALIVWAIYLLNKKVNKANNYKEYNEKKFFDNSEKKSKNSYEILGITKNVSQKELKRAYKNLASKYHPDKVEHLGDDLKEYAKKKFIEINRAYEDILKEKGWA